MKKTIIIGNFEYLNRKVIIHSIDEVYQATTQEELEAILDTFDQEGTDWLVLETTIYTLEITAKGLLKLIWGDKYPITNNAIKEGGQKV
jgi:hypothetical protein